MYHCLNCNSPFQDKRKKYCSTQCVGLAQTLKAWNDYEKSQATCEFCAIRLTYAQRSNKFCGSSCAAKHTNSKRKHSVETKLKISKTLSAKFADAAETEEKISKTVSAKFAHVDWDDIQNSYNNGHSMEKSGATYGLSKKQVSCAVERGQLTTKKKKKTQIGNTFVENSATGRKTIKKEIIKNNLIPYNCAECNCHPFWNGEQLVLILDHINGVHNDHRLENLRFLCPNCNSQGDTFAGKNRKRKSSIRNDALLEALKKHDTVEDAFMALGMDLSANSLARLSRLKASRLTMQ